MGKTLVLKAEVREHTGRKAVQKMRQQGAIPAVVYGHKEDPVPVSLNAHDFVEGLHHGQRLMDIQIGKKKEKIVVKEVQYDHLGKNVIHADLMRVDVTELIRVTVPIELKGTAAGTHEGGIVEAHAGHLEIECKATDIPEKIIISVKDMHVGDTLHAGDIGLPEGVKLVTAAGMVLVTCHTVAVKTTEEVEEETPAAPEVITEKKAEEAAAPEE
jgi:large subunit ribosomal protein L25